MPMPTFDERVRQMRVRQLRAHRDALLAAARHTVHVWTAVGAAGHLLEDAITKLAAIAEAERSES